MLQAQVVGPAVDFGPVQAQRAFGRRPHAHHDAGQRRFAAAAGTDQPGKRTLLQREVDAAHHRRFATGRDGA